MHQPDSQEAPPKNQNREMNSDGELTRHELKLELTRDQLTEEELSEELRDSRRLSLLYPGTSTAPENSRANQESTRRYSGRC